MNNNEQSNKKRTTGILLSILAIISLVLITAGVTYAFFSYAKEGLTENVLTTGTITFYYDEKAGIGKGVNITEAMPLNDNAGMALTKDDQVFDFQITSEVSKGANIPYMITVRKDKSSTLTGDKVKVYLDIVDNFNSVTTGSGSTKKIVKEGDTNHTLKSDSDVKLFSELTALKNDNDEASTTGTTITSGTADNKLTVTVPKGIDERIIYEGVVPADSIAGSDKQKYTANFRLRMWVNGENDINGTAAADYSAYEFVKTSASQNGSPDNIKDEALDAAALINKGDLITSTGYYNLDDEQRKSYERIAYVDQTNGKFYSVSQAEEKGWVEVDETTGQVTKKEPQDASKPEDGFTFSEQYYSLNGKTFKLTVNVYANAVVVDGE